MIRIIKLFFGWAIEAAKVLRGGHTFWQLYLAMLFGFAAGMIPGFTVTHTAILLLVIFLNVNGTVALLAYGAGVSVKYALAPFTNSAGKFLLHDAGLGRVAGKAGDTPLLALMDLHVYSVTGAIPVILLLGAVGGWFATKALLAFRVIYFEKTDALGTRYPRLRHPAVRWVIAVILDQRKGVDEAYQYPSIFAFWRILTALFLFFWIWLFVWFYADGFAYRTLHALLSPVSGGNRVDISGVDFSPLTGSLEVHQIEVFDKDRPDYYLFTVYNLEAKVSIRELLRNRIVVERAGMEWFRLDHPRTAEGRADQFSRMKQSRPSAGLDLTKAESYYHEVKTLYERFMRLEERLELYGRTMPQRVDNIETASRENLRRREKLLVEQDDRLLTPHPSWVIRRLNLDKIELMPNLPIFAVKVTEMSSHPSLHGTDMAFDVTIDPESLKAFTRDAMEEMERELNQGINDLKSQWRRLF